MQLHDPKHREGNACCGMIAAVPLAVLIWLLAVALLAWPLR